MSSNWDYRSQAAQNLATSRRDQFQRSQGDEPFLDDDLIPNLKPTIAMSGNHEDVEVEITAGQKMLSAMSGSLLTSLLGTSSPVG